jgi:Zn-dependent protease with chaperone function
MKHALRAACSALKIALLLVLVAALSAATVLVVAKLLVAAVMSGGAWAVVAGVVVVGMLAAAGIGLLAVRRRPCEQHVGVPVTPHEHPLLWVEINRVADGLGTRAPDQVSLVPQAFVVASERGTWLGLRPGVRRLSLGLPLLAGLTERQLRAVITHELCRRWGPASLGRVIQRLKEIIERVAGHLGQDSRFGKGFVRFGEVFLADSGPVSAGHELQADRLSAELAGNRAASSALRELAVLSAGWVAFVDEYAEPARRVGRRPQDVFAGFACFLEDADRRAQLTKEAGAPGSRQLTAYGSQLSLGERLAAIASLPEDEMPDTSGPAIYLLRDPRRVVCQVEESMFLGMGFVLATWEDIFPEVGRAAACEDALQLARLSHEGGLGPNLSIAALLEIIALGLAEEMVRPMLAEGGSQEAERQWAGRLVTGFLATAAVEAGTASYRSSWAAAPVLVDDQGEDDNLHRLVDIALANRGEVSALELWLASHGVGQELELGADQGQAVGGAGLQGGPDDDLDDGPDDGLDDGLDDDNLEDSRSLLVPSSRGASI